MSNLMYTMYSMTFLNVTKLKVLMEVTILLQKKNSLYTHVKPHVYNIVHDVPQCHTTKVLMEVTIL